MESYSGIMLFYSLISIIIMVKVANLSNVIPSLGGSRSPTIHILAVIDTDSLYDRFKNENVSKDVENPTGIDHSFAYLVAPRKFVVDKVGTADLHLKSKIGDTLFFSAISESGNFESNVFMAGISPTEYWDDPKLLIFNRDTIAPIDRTFIKFGTHKNSYFLIRTNTMKAGTVAFNCKFAMYVDTDTENKSLFGIFEWDPQITITESNQSNLDQ